MKIVAQESSRYLLLETTGRLPREQGFAATTVSQILEQRGISHSSLYYLFPSGKTELAAAAVASIAANQPRGLKRPQTRHPYAREGIAAMFHFCRELQESDYTKGSLLAAMA
ncbi:helix-turn-helix transcriptional regulator [bacterium]|nr:helix-turn-helix transcriptional regulator [bacterium]